MLTAPLYSYLSKSLFWFWEIFAKISKNSLKWYKINKLLFLLPCLCKLPTPSSCVTACVFLFILFAKMTKLFQGTQSASHCSYVQVLCLSSLFIFTSDVEISIWSDSLVRSSLIISTHPPASWAPSVAMRLSTLWCYHPVPVYLITSYQTCPAAHGKHTLVAMVEISQPFILRAAKTRFFHSSS